MIIGIDYGSKRVGLAVSDEGERVAFPFSVIGADQNLLEAVTRIAKEKGARKIVMGESKNYKGEPNGIFSSSQIFKTELEKNGYEVIFEPEFLTSVQAERFQGKNDKIDASAAAIILQSYLDRVNSK